MTIWYYSLVAIESVKDLTIIYTSNLFGPVRRGEVSYCDNIANTTQYHLGYCLVDGIYLKWATLIKVVNEKYMFWVEAFLTKRHDSHRKDI